GESGPGLAPPARIADPGGVVADHEDDLVAELLEGAQLPDRDGVADVEVRPRRVESLLDAERPAGGDAALQLPYQIVLGGDLHRVAADLVHLLVEGREIRHAFQPAGPGIRFQVSGFGCRVSGRGGRPKIRCMVWDV